MTDAASDGARLSFDRRGTGEPLLLLHGTGSSREVWTPVIDRLARERDVIAVDLPGHGLSPLPPEGVAPTPIGYSSLLSEFLDGLGLHRVAVAGNSVGGWTALELAKAGRARAVVALGPAGLWRRRNPRSAYYSLRSIRRMSPLLVRAAPVAFRSRAGRTLVFGQTFGRPWLLPPDVAERIVRTMANTRGFDEHLEGTSHARFEGGAAITVPVTIAFGTREHLIPRRGRRRDELPPHAKWISLPGCGHVPTWDDPALVARVILEGTAP